MLLGEDVLEGFDFTRRRDRSGDECDADRFEWLRRKGLGGEPGPEAVAIAGNRCEASDVVPANEIVDFGAFHIRAAVIAATEAGISSARPRTRQPCGKILRIGAHIERRRGIAPDLPRGRRRTQSRQKPALLFFAENGLRRIVFAEVGNVCAAVANGFRGSATVVGVTRVEDHHRFLRHHLGEIV